MRHLVLMLPLLAACGDDGHAAVTDGAVDVPIDMPLVIDAPPPPMGHHRYVMDTMRVPTTNNEARDFGLDLDGNAVVDNQYGMVLSTVASMGIEIQPQVTAQVDRGQVLELFDLGAASFTAEPAATFTAFAGATPMPSPCNGAGDTQCRRHLAGTGTFTIAAGSPINPALTGTIATGAMTTAPGHLLAPVAAFSGTGTPIYLTLIGAKVHLAQASDARIMELTLAGGISQTDIDTKLIPALQVDITAQVMKDCTMLSNPPTCGCAANSNGKTFLDLFDAAPKNCAVTVQELRDNSLIQSLFATDVMLEGQMALSIGVRVTAVAAGFAGP